MHEYTTSHEYTPSEEDVYFIQPSELLLVPAQFTIHALLENNKWRLIAAAPNIVPALEIAHFWHRQFTIAVEVRDPQGIVTLSLPDQDIREGDLNNGSRSE